MRKIDFRLYLITDRKLLPPGKLIEKVEEYIQLGVRSVQVREKDFTAREIFQYTLQLKRDNVDVFVNDRADIAHSAGVNIHLPEHGLSATDVKVIDKNMLIGKSVHSIDTAVMAEDTGVDFVTLGPIFETESKMKYGKPLGLDKLKEIAGRVTIPIFAIGGINPLRAEKCRDSGAFGVAVISDLLLAKNPELQIEQYRKALSSL
ncbi:MAG: thiamine phosphate synthase [bacterium]